MLERAKTCDEAMQVFGDVLTAHGQGGNCELRGNSHFDSSYLVSDKASAYVIESAGRQWAARKVEGVGAISNALTIGKDWDRCSVPQNGDGRVDFGATCANNAKAASGVARQKTEFMAECWRRAAEATDRWIADLDRRNYTFQRAASAGLWDRFDRAASMPWVQ